MELMEFLQPAGTNQLGKDNYRCTQLGLGSSLQCGDHGRTLVTDRGLVPQKLPGNVSSLPSSSVLYKGHFSPLTVYLYMDNTTVFSYMNHKGQTTSPSLCMQVIKILQWCMSQKISLAANHLPRHLNTVADRESRVPLDRWHWQLHLKIFLKVNQI